MVAIPEPIPIYGVRFRSYTWISVGQTSFTFVNEWRPFAYEAEFVGASLYGRHRLVCKDRRYATSIAEQENVYVLKDFRRTNGFSRPRDIESPWTRCPQ